MACTLRPCATPGPRYLDKPPDMTVATLGPDGTWAVFKGTRFTYEPVEIVGPDIDAIADFLMELRDRAPDIEGTSLDWLVVNSAFYCTLDRQIVVEARYILRPQWSDEEEPTPRPLRSIALAMREYYAWFLGRE